MWIVCAVLAAAVVAVAGFGVYELKRSSPAISVELLRRDPLLHAGGVLQFAFGDMGALDLDTLDTAALPWRLVVTALALQEAGGRPAEASLEGARTALRRAGFLFPERFGNAPDLRPGAGPLGVTVGAVERTVPPLSLTVANLGCAACHAGATYGPDGRPRPGTAWLGAPNTSLDLQRYTLLVYRAMKAGLADRTALEAAMARVHPDLGWRERATLRLVVMPRVEARLAEAAAQGDRPLPFPNGMPGMTNGVAALKNSLRLPQAVEAGAGPGFVSIPDLGALPFRSALLADGAYVARGETRFRAVSSSEAARREPAKTARVASFFTVPSMGMSSARAKGAIPALTEVATFLAGYEPQPFPGPVDRERASLGRDVYAARCASCHGTYDGNLERPRLLSFPNWHGDVGTDMSRAKAFTPELARAVASTSHGDDLDPASTSGYRAPPLAGVWASAPYFVAGSVPTLQHLLEPASRPSRFLVGGHALDFEAVGIALKAIPDGVMSYPDGFEPFSTPAVVDTALPGFSRTGHEREVEGLSAPERAALLEYLKLL